MEANPFLGVLLHAIGGLAAASFYLPLKRVRGWSWESGWIVNGFFSWVVMPLVLSAIMVPSLGAVLGEAPASSIGWSFFFGLLWGIGGLTFGLSVRYLGVSLGYAIALGFCAALGTVIPPIFNGEFMDLLGRTSGQTTLLGVLVCLGGIAVCGWAGVEKEKALAAGGQSPGTDSEFNIVRGLIVAVLAGALSACMAFAIAAGKPIAEAAAKHGVAPLWVNTPVFVIVFAGGFLTNFIWCTALILRNRSGRDFINASNPLPLNYLFAAAAGIIWYFQFMFYGMGTTQMGEYEFSSWTLHMASIIFFSTLWGVALLEWKGAGRKALGLVTLGLALLVLSTLIVGAGNYIEGAAATH